MNLWSVRSARRHTSEQIRTHRQVTCICDVVHILENMGVLGYFSRSLRFFKEKDYALLKVQTVVCYIQVGVETTDVMRRPWPL